MIILVNIKKVIYVSGFGSRKPKTGPCFPRDLVFQVKVQDCDREVILWGLSEVSASDAGSEGIPSW